MEAIQEAIRRLENIPTTVRQGKDVEGAIIQLSSMPRLLELPSASPNIFARLAENLRGRLLPLYRASLSLALDYAIAVFQFIYHSKLVPTLEAGRSSPNSWETLLVSLFSGLLDVLDENPSNKTRENIAYALYPVVCPLFFVPTSRSSLFFHSELLSTVYQTLTGTVASHPLNAATLREHHIERKGIGIVISQTKDFLAIESLLDLFGSLLPSLKGGRDIRTAYIKDVFDPLVFKNTGNRIHKLLEDISSPDWSVTSEKIIGIMAESDISFPQPFDASGLSINKSFMDSFSPFYIDKNQFVINIDKDGRIETLSIPYSITKNILASTSIGDNVQIIVQLTTSPMLGNQPMISPSKGNLTISWNVKKLSLTSFGKALRSRDLSIGQSGSNKLSKVKPIELDFTSNKEDSQVLTQKRFEQLSRSWAIAASPKKERIDVQPETSPLLPDALRQGTRPSNADEVASLSTLFVNPDGNLSFMPQMQAKFPETPTHSRPTTPHSYNKVTIQENSDEDVKTLLPKFKRRHLIVSDDEFESSVEDESKSAKSFASKATSRMLPKKQPPSTPTTPNSPLIVKENEKIKFAKFQKPDPDLSHASESKRLPRPTADVELDVIDVDADKKHKQQPKRGHQEASNPVSARPFKRVKYSRKGRTSSPAALSPSQIDFEEIPKPEPPKKVGLESSTKTKASAMKGRNGKPVPKSKASAKKKIAKVQHADPDVNPNMNHPAKGFLNVPSPIKERVNHPEGTAVRRSARTSNLRLPSKEPETRSVAESYAPKKPRKAPWEDPYFLDKAKGLSDQVIPSFDPVHFSPAAQVDVAQRNEQSSDIDFFTDKSQSNEPATVDRQGLHAPAQPLDVLNSVEKPKKLKNPVVSNHPVQEAVIIDLTADTSPNVHRKPKKISRPPEICICKTHQTRSHPLAEEETLKKEEFKKRDGVTMETSTPFSDKAKKSKPSGKSFLEKIKLEEQTSPQSLSNVRKIEEASPSVRRTTSTLRSKIPKVRPASLAAGDQNEPPTVNFALSRLEFFQPTNNIRISPIKAFKAVGQYDRERQMRDSLQYNNNRHAQNSQTRAQVLQNKIALDPMQRILEVVQQINEVVVHNIENRFEKVTESLSGGQRAILGLTANSLQEMYRESAQHFNEMVDLEEEYASHSKTITSGTHDYIKSSEQLAQCLKDVALDHGRKSLSKKLPTTLFPKLPAIILNPAIKL